MSYATWSWQSLRLLSHLSLIRGAWFDFDHGAAVWPDRPDGAPLASKVAARTLIMPLGKV